MSKNGLPPRRNSKKESRRENKSKEEKISRSRRPASPFVYMCLLNPNTHIVRYYNGWIEVIIAQI